MKALPLDDVIGVSMGVSLGWSGKKMMGHATAAFLALASVLVFLTLPIWIVESQRLSTVVRLSIWGALYFSVATIMARRATAAVKPVIFDEVYPLMSEAQRTYVRAALDDRFSDRRKWLVSMGVATLASGASWIALQTAHFQTWSLALILIEFFLLYLTGAQATYAASFYVTLAEAIDEDPQALSPLRNGESPIVVAVRSVGAIVLLFWFGIMLAVLTLVAFRATVTDFVLVVVPVASFFSFMRGSAVFIAFESRLRRACRRAAASVRLRLDAEARVLIDRLPEPGGTAIQRLDTINKILEATTSRGTAAFFLVIVSIITPFVAPVVSLLVHFYGK